VDPRDDQHEADGGEQHQERRTHVFSFRLEQTGDDRPTHAADLRTVGRQTARDALDVLARLRDADARPHAPDHVEAAAARIAHPALRAELPRVADRRPDVDALGWKLKLRARDTDDRVRMVVEGDRMPQNLSANEFAPPQAVADDR